MYEMYPDTWAAADKPQAPATTAKPRRRARKQHSVLPAVLAHLAPPVRTDQAEPGLG